LSADLKLSSNCREFSASSGFIARLDFGELARWGRMEEQIRESRCEIRIALTEIRALSFLESRLSNLALTLLVLGVLADDANDTATVNHLALVADRLY
jgi:hypothetical protein